jgi:hypothetical protein
LLVALFAAMGDAFAAASAEKMTATAYDDGRVCPANCDANVVFHPDRNGTRSAFLPPLNNRSTPAQHACISGQECMICFSEPDSTCITVMYRGSGPHRRAFDFTPAWYHEHCADPNLPGAVRTACDNLNRNAAKLQAGINCFENKSDPKCQEKMKVAAAAKDADDPEYALCERLGVSKYNAQQHDPLKWRSRNAGCGYAANQIGRNSRGETWQKLLPGACRPGDYVGPNGTDCCSGDPLQAAIDLSECLYFYPRQK